MIHRRRLLGSIGIAALAPALLHCSSGEPPPTLRVLTWPGYADRDLVGEFERLHGLRVELTIVHTDEELWSRIAANDGADFDVFAVNTAELARYIDARLSAALDPQSIPNIGRQLPAFRDRARLPALERDGKVYAIPYTYSTMGLIYDRSRVRETPVSWQSMWDPAYRGRVIAYDGSSHAFSFTALALGMPDPFRLDEAAYREVTQRLIELRRNALTFYKAPEEVVDLFLRHDVALAYGNYGTQQLKQLADAGIDAGYVIPREGALAWLDCWAMTRGARDPRLVAAWIDYMLEDHVSQALTLRQGLANTTVASIAAADAARIRWLQPVEDVARRTRLWERIRSGDALESF